MSERRPHWTDDLIESVQRILDREWSRPEGPHEKAYDIIAAVEDWARWEHVPKGTLARIERARELHGRLEVTGLSGPSFVCLECYDTEHPCDTIRALDGERDE